MSLSKAKKSIAFNFLFSQNCFIRVLVRCTNFPKVNKFFMFRVSIIHIVITWPSRNQVSFHARPRLLHTFSPIRAVTGWFTLVPLHTITVVSISLKKKNNEKNKGSENNYQGPIGRGKSRWVGACNSYTKPMSEHLLQTDLFLVYLPS